MPGQLEQAKRRLDETRAELALAEHKVRDLEIIEQQRVNQVHQACLDEFGSHIDNGGFMYGTCVRCGECLN